MEVLMKVCLLMAYYKDSNLLGGQMDKNLRGILKEENNMEKEYKLEIMEVLMKVIM